jgi:excisionase family DNA binding protein
VPDPQPAPAELLALEQRWMSRSQAAAYLGVTPGTVYRLIDAGRLPAYRFGRVIRLTGADLDAYIETARIRPGSLRHLHDPDNDDDGDQAQAGDEQPPSG